MKSYWTCAFPAVACIGSALIGEWSAGFAWGCSALFLHGWIKQSLLTDDALSAARELERQLAACEAGK